MDPERNPGAKVPAGATDPAPTAEVSGGSSAPEPAADRSARAKRPRAGSKTGTHPNNVKKLRQSAMMSKAELARRAGVSPLTIDRVEAGCPCRMDTKRKILEALGLQPAAAKDVFPEIELG